MRSHLRLFCAPAILTGSLCLAGVEAGGIEPRIAARQIEESGISKVYLAPRFTKAIRMPEAVNSVVVGDPAAFAAEHSEKEPNLVFVKPATLEKAETNLLISTVSGHQVSLLLVSRGEGKGEATPMVDFLMRYKPPGRFVVDRTVSPSAVVPRTADLVRRPDVSAKPVVATARRANDRTALDDLLDRQRRAPLPKLYGIKPGVAEPGREPVKTGVSEVIDEGRQVVVLFSAVNTQKHPVELMPPQVQLGGKRKKGMLRREQWALAEQLHVIEWRLNRRLIGPGERADGVLVFERPSYKQAKESVFLQMAESGSVDRPALAPIGFGIDSIRKGGAQ